MTVHAHNRPVRQILTDCVPLKHYSRGLWTAETSENDGKLKTAVQYFGPED